MHGVGTVKKRGAKRKVKFIESHLLLPEQVAHYMTPLYVSLPLLPRGEYTADHANKLAQMINLMVTDAFGRHKDILQVAEIAGEILTAMRGRVAAGKSWNCTVEERDTLSECIVIFDNHMRSWTTARLMTNAATVDANNLLAKERGGKLFDRVETLKSDTKAVEAIAQAVRDNYTAAKAALVPAQDKNYFRRFR